MNEHFISYFISSLIEKNKGVDFWWKNDHDAELIKTLSVTGGSPNLEKSTDIFDIWFDSGSTFNSVLSAQSDLYCEGMDQFTGWFQSSLLLSVALKDQAPYKSLLVHGFVVDEQHRKMSKSLGNVIEPQQAIRGVANKLPQCGLDTLRFWIAHEYYKPQIQIGPSILDKFIKRSFEIRSIVRFVTGNLSDLDAPIEYSQLIPTDKYILHKLNDLIDQVKENYDDMQLNKSVNLIENFLLTQLSSFYVKAVKDRLYCDRRDSLERRSAQTALYHVLSKILVALGPVMPHLAEEAYLNSSLAQKHGQTLFRSDLKLEIVKEWQNTDIDKLFQLVLLVKEKFNEKIQNNNPAVFKAVVGCDKKVLEVLISNINCLEECIGCAKLELQVSNEGMGVDVEDVSQIVSSCLRCRRYVCENNKKICERCSKVVQS